jgi:hypothetical protein
LQVLGAGDALGGPARPGGNFAGKTPNLGAAPHDWGFAKKAIEKATDEKATEKATDEKVN